MRYFLLLFFTFNTLIAKPLIIGMELSYPPFETVDEAGNPSGISVDLAKALGKELNREVVVKNIPYIGLVPALKNGQIDLILSSMASTEKRRKSIEFSDPYLTIGLALLVGKNSSLKEGEELNQKGRKVVVKMGTSSQIFAENHLKEAEVIILDKESAAVLEVVQGKADAFLYDQFSIFNNWQKNQETTKPLLTPLQKEQWAFGIRKGNKKLRDQVNVFLKKFRNEGGFEVLSDRYLKEEKKYFKEQDIPFIFSS